MLKAFVWVGW